MEKKMTTTSLIAAVYLNDPGLIKHIMLKHNRTISDQQIVAAQNLCTYLKREYLLECLQRPFQIY